VNKPRQISGLSIVAIFGTPVRLAVEQPVAHLPDAAKIDLRLGDPQRERLQRRLRAVTGDARRERADLRRCLRIGPDRQAQAVAQRVARRPGLAGRGARSLTGAAVPAAGRGAPLATHATGAIEAACASIT